MERSELERKGECPDTSRSLGPTWRDKKSPRAALSLSTFDFWVWGVGGLGLGGWGVGGFGVWGLVRGFGCPFIFLVG